MSIWPWSQNQLLKKALAMYAGDHVLQRILRDGSVAFEPSSEVLDTTVAYFDAIPAFPYLSYSALNEKLRVALGGYREIVATLVAEYRGNLDIFYGDSVIAWSTSATHAPDAVSCALQIVKALDEAGIAGAEAGMPALKAAIGVASNPMLISNYGSTSRMRFAPLGEPLNLAARLSQRSNHKYPYPILTEECTVRLLGPQFPVAHVDAVDMEGQERKVMLYGLG